MNNNLIQTDARTGYTYLPVTPSHILNWGGLAICDHCNQSIQHVGYLVFVLNSCICPHCFNEWIAHAHIYPDDLQTQRIHQGYWYGYHIRHGRIGKEVNDDEN